MSVSDVFYRFHQTSEGMVTVRILHAQGVVSVTPPSLTQLVFPVFVILAVLGEYFLGILV